MEVASAGLEPTPVNPLTVAVMREVGSDVSAHKSHSIGEYLGRRRFQYVVMVCKGAEVTCPVLWPFTLTQLSWPFDDPASATGTDEVRLDAFRSVRDKIEAQVTSWVGELRASGVLSCVESIR